MNRELGAGPQLDAVLHEQFLGGDCAGGWLAAPPEYSSSIAAAVALLESDRWPSSWVLRRWHRPACWQVLDTARDMETVSEAATAALAISQAALRVVTRKGRFESSGVLHEPAGPRDDPVPPDLRRVYKRFPSCYAIRLWRRKEVDWWRGSFGPAADIEEIARHLVRAGFDEIRPIGPTCPTDIWLRPARGDE